MGSCSLCSCGWSVDGYNRTTGLGSRWEVTISRRERDSFGIWHEWYIRGLLFLHSVMALVTALRFDGCSVGGKSRQFGQRDAEG